MRHLLLTSLGLSNLWLSVPTESVQWYTMWDFLKAFDVNTSARYI